MLTIRGFTIKGDYVRSKRCKVNKNIGRGLLQYVRFRSLVAITIEEFQLVSYIFHHGADPDYCTFVFSRKLMQLSKPQSGTEDPIIPEDSGRLTPRFGLRQS